jgi:hypothetical protein
VSNDPGSDRGHAPSPLPVSPVIATTYRPIVKGSSIAAGHVARSMHRARTTGYGDRIDRNPNAAGTFL